MQFFHGWNIIFSKNFELIKKIRLEISSSGAAILWPPKSNNCEHPSFIIINLFWWEKISLCLWFLKQTMEKDPYQAQWLIYLNIRSIMAPTGSNENGIPRPSIFHSKSNKIFNSTNFYTYKTTEKISYLAAEMAASRFGKIPSAAQLIDLSTRIQRRGWQAK